MKKKDIVALAAFPKSGVTYLSSLLFFSMFPDAKDDVANIERKYIIDVHVHPYKDSPTAFGKHFVKSHHFFGGNPRLDDRTSKAIYLIRHPVDVMNSAFDFRRLLKTDDDKLYSNFADEWMSSGGGGFEVSDTWVNHLQSWLTQKDVPVLLVKYADLVDRPEPEVQRIFEFLQINPNPSDVAFAIKSSSMAAMRAREEEELESKKEGVFYNSNVAEGMSQGARFINKGYRNSFDKLNEQQKAAAENRFGALIKQYL